MNAKDIAARVVQDACETDPADAEHPNTVLITTDDLELIVRRAVEEAQSGWAPPRFAVGERVKWRRFRDDLSSYWAKGTVEQADAISAQVREDGATGYDRVIHKALRPLPKAPTQA